MGRIVFILGFLAILDWCTLFCIKKAFPIFYSKHRSILLISYATFHIIFFAGVGLGFFARVPRLLRTISFVGLFVVYFSKLFTIFSVIAVFLYTGFRKLRLKIINHHNHHEVSLPPLSGPVINRSTFLAKSGLALASLPLISLNAGMIKGVYDYQVRKQKIIIPNLPSSFEGIQIAQISDIHSGSFYNKRAVNLGIDLLLSLKADILFFTGDLVNDRTSEMKDYQDIFSRLKAPLGVFSILGNHDYGDYVSWSDAAAKKKNLDDLKAVHRHMGYDLLLNEHRKIKIENQEIAVLGIENWGALSHFPKYGRVDLALKGAENVPVKLLLSHDPSHWRAQVVPLFKEVDMMFSGHTHGMQMGIRTNAFQWSPIQYVYPEWAGLYRQGDQQLYVNVGYGFLGYPGRIGILPEITLFELSSKA